MPAIETSSQRWLEAAAALEQSIRDLPPVPAELADIVARLVALAQEMRHRAARAA